MHERVEYASIYHLISDKSKREFPPIDADVQYIKTETMIWAAGTIADHEVVEHWWIFECDHQKFGIKARPY